MPEERTPSTMSPAPRRRLAQRIALGVSGFLLAYFLIAYIVVPRIWVRYAHRHPALDDLPGITVTRSDIPGDPINVALVGSKRDVIKIMLDAKWDPADPLSLKSSLEIAEATVLRRPYDEAPVSNLYLWGRKEDLAFEKPVGADPRKRHHVRFWESTKRDDAGLLLWAGSVTYDERVGLSHTTGQITHHIGPDIDAERDLLFRDLEATGHLAKTEIIADFHKKRSGENGGGDPWSTDGRLFVGWIVFPAGP